MNVNVEIQTLEMAKKGEGVLDIKPTDITEIDVKEVGILQGGTTSGRASILVVMEDKDGNVFTTQFTERIFEGVHGILQGAKARWEGE